MALAITASLAPLVVLAAQDVGPVEPPARAPVMAAPALAPPVVPAQPIAVEAVPQLVTEPPPTAAGAPAPTPQPVAALAAGPTFAERHPAQAAAFQDLSIPASTRWALIIGINDHLGGMRDNIGSRQDAEDLRAHLLASGWRDENILVITDRAATGAAIVEGIRWLADKTDPWSTAVFHYSGHSKKWYGEDPDGDGEVPDEGLWPTDDRFITDSELVRLLAPVDASVMWISFAACHAAGFADPGLAGPGRVLTFSSGEPQKSYEHPAWDNSVWGHLMIDRGMRQGGADLDRDGQVSVQEAWTWARPQASDTTRGQREGPQDAVMVDDLGVPLHLAVPGAPIPPPRPAPSPAVPRTEPAPPNPAPQRAPQPPPERAPEPEREGGYLCLLCGG